MRLSNKVLVVTGGNSGIGLAAAKLFVAEGAKVAVTGRNESTLRQAADALGPAAFALRADSNDYGATQRAFAQIAERFGKFEGVFVNAGAASVTPLGQTTPEAFEELVRSNFSSAFFTTQAALPHLRDGSSLVFNGSVLASLGMPGWSAYGGAKGAIRSMVRVLASELAPRRIRVNQVTPGGTKTPLWTPMAPTAQAQEILDARISAATPLGRMGEADDVARVVLFLVSDDSTHVTGTELVVDGGATQAPAGAPIFRSV
ncbi:MAG TPA: SDR family oxidoreductase [Polyangiaceae bacterium]|nr:SDR family oxidoreductase [Polyangiaceae bacterium]